MICGTARGSLMSRFAEATNAWISVYSITRSPFTSAAVTEYGMAPVLKGCCAANVGAGPMPTALSSII